MSALRGAARGGLQLLHARTGWAAQQSSGFNSLTLGSWWQGTSSTVAAPSGALGWQRVTALLPSALADMQWLAAPKKKVSPHRKGKRSANKFIRFVPVVSQCSKCQRVFQQHSMPSKCEEDECPAFNLRARPDA